MGDCVKTIIRFQRPFWRDNNLSGAAFSNIGPLSEIHDHSGPDCEAYAGTAALLGFSSGGNGSSSSRSVGGAPEKSAVVAQLVRLFGPLAASDLLLDIIQQNWASEQFTSPALPPPLPLAAASASRFALGKDVQQQIFAEGAWKGRLLFCSTEDPRTTLSSVTS